MAAARRFSLEERLSHALAASLLEKVCGRAALLAGDVESYAGAGLGLELDCGMTDDLRKDQRCSLKGQVMMPGWCDCCGAGGTGSWDRREADSRLLRRLRHARAVMCAVSSAARRQICVGAGCEGQHRRDQRKAEEEQQREGEYTSHSAIVTIFVSWCVSGMSFWSFARLNWGR
jgi:hypothetical protein